MRKKSQIYVESHSDGDWVFSEWEKSKLKKTLGTCLRKRKEFKIKCIKLSYGKANP